MPTTTTPARPAPLETIAARAAADAAQDADHEAKPLHPLVAVGAGLIAGLLLARWVRR